jgi:hypothetical protein
MLNLLSANLLNVARRRKKRRLGSTAFENKIHILHHWLSIPKGVTKLQV